MDGEFSIYCDESCHLENDGINQMVLGAVWCPKKRVKEINTRIKEIQAKHVSKDFELKWTKISASLSDLYLEILDYFFDDDDLHFRGLIVPDKSILNHAEHSQTHDEWYYKMFFTLLNVILDPDKTYSIFLDYKDTHGGERIKKLREVLCNKHFDFSMKIIKQTELVKSYQVPLIQLTDLIIGALSYNARNLESNIGKVKMVERIKERSGYDLTRNTLYREDKFNFLIWRPREVDFQ